MKVTLKTLPKATAQQVFDQIAKHLLTQNKHSMNEGYCAYRGDDKLKCAAGCLISDKEYSPSMEGNNWEELVEDKLVPDNYRDLIRRLQSIHDIHTIPEWKGLLENITKDFNLNTKVVQKF